MSSDAAIKSITCSTETPSNDEPVTAAPMASATDDVSNGRIRNRHGTKAKSMALARGPATYDVAVSGTHPEAGADKRECSNTVFTKVGINPTNLKVIPELKTFAWDNTTASVNYNSTGPMDYAKSAGCSSKCTCGEGYHMIDLRNTQFHLPIDTYFLRQGTNAFITGCTSQSYWWWWGGNCGSGKTWRFKLTTTSKFVRFNHDGVCSQLTNYVNNVNQGGIWFELDGIP